MCFNIVPCSENVRTPNTVMTYFSPTSRKEGGKEGGREGGRKRGGEGGREEGREGGRQRKKK